MESQVFEFGNYIWECKTSHTDSPGGGIEVNLLRSSIKSLETRWKNGNYPSGYYYVFPVNLVSNDAKEILENFISGYKGEIDISYYDRNQMQRLIHKLNKMSDMNSLVGYIKQHWKE